MNWATRPGLVSLNKSITVDQNVAAVDTLKQLGIRFEFGFMLFEPSTTFATVREDLAFLRRIVGDGSTAAGFCRMVPYDGTPIKDELIKSGRLRGDVCNPYYDFLDPKLGEFCYDLGQVLKVTGWMHGLDSVSQTLNVAWSEFAVMERLFPRLPGIDDYRVTLKDITRSSNALLFSVIEDMADFHEHGAPHAWSAALLRERCQGFVETFLAERDALRLPQPGRLSCVSQYREPNARGCASGLDARLVRFVAATIGVRASKQNSSRYIAKFRNMRYCALTEISAFRNS